MAKRGSAVAIPNTLQYNSPQGNVLGAERIGAVGSQDRFAMDVYYGSRDEQRNPYHPVLFGLAKPGLERLASRFGGQG
ncbi:hypothetical protein D3C87_1936870 [compost metagenome]